MARAVPGRMPLSHKHGCSLDLAMAAAHRFFVSCTAGQPAAPKLLRILQLFAFVCEEVVWQLWFRMTIRFLLQVQTLKVDSITSMLQGTKKTQKGLLAEIGESEVTPPYLR